MCDTLVSVQAWSNFYIPATASIVLGDIFPIVGFVYIICGLVSASLTADIMGLVSNLLTEHDTQAKSSVSYLTESIIDS
jgi:hypothetical protein